MSTSYDLKCVDCDVLMGWMHQTDYKLQLMNKLCASAKQLALMGDIVETIGVLGFEGLEVSTERLVIPFGFFQVHAQHRLAVYDEYGRDVTHCWKDVKCGGCGHVEWCRLPLNHDGECKVKS